MKLTRKTAALASVGVLLAAVLGANTVFASETGGIWDAILSAFRPEETRVEETVPDAHVHAPGEECDCEADIAPFDSISPFTTIETEPEETEPETQPAPKPKSGGSNYVNPGNTVTPEATTPPASDDNCDPPPKEEYVPEEPPVVIETTPPATECPPLPEVNPSDKNIDDYLIELPPIPTAPDIAPVNPASVGISDQGAELGD